MENKRRLRSLDILKGIAIISVVIGHAGFGSLITRYLSSFHLQLFFFVSGLLFSSSKNKVFSAFAQKRVRSLLIPYASFAILTIVVCAICSLLVKANIFNLPSSLWGIVWSNKSIFPITGGIWFLQCMFIVEIGYWLITRVVDSRYLPLIPVVFAGLAYLQVYFGLLLPFSIDSALSAMVFFCIGNVLRPYFNKVNSFSVSGLKLGIVGICLIIVGAILSFANGSVNPRTCEYGIILLYFICALVSIFGYTLFSIGLDRQKSRYFNRINQELEEAGKNSLVYLGLNQLILTGLFACVDLISFPDSNIFKATRNILLCVLTCIIIKYLSRLILSTKLKAFLGK